MVSQPPDASSPDWVARWEELSAPARLAVARDVRAPSSPDSLHPPFITITRLAAAVVDELTAAGFIERRPGLSDRQTERLIVPPSAVEFVLRMQRLFNLHLLEAGRHPNLEDYLRPRFNAIPFDRRVARVLHEVGLDLYHISRGAILEHYVPEPEWPDWAARSLNDAVAGAVLGAIDKAGGVVALDELPALLPDADPEALRRAVAGLIETLALFEGLRPGTLDLLVGYLTPVREGRRRSRKPRPRPPLVLSPPPAEMLPEGGVEVNDLRAFLLELASSPARLRQNQTLYQKEEERFKPGLDPLSEWAAGFLRLSVETRLNTALYWCRVFKLSRTVSRGGATLLELAREGQEWLASGLAEQYTRLFDYLRTGRAGDGHYAYRHSDVNYLGVDVRAYETPPRHSGWVELTAAQRDRLREAFHSSLSSLPAGQFVQLESFLEHAAFGPFNPLNLGLEPGQVTLYVSGIPVPPTQAQREAAGRRCLGDQIRTKLLPLGCLLAGLDESGHPCIARHARLDAYFGREIPPEQMAGAMAAAGSARVVVQPDFSVVVIGLNPTASAELVPFCERVGGRSGQGLLQLRITRAAVVKAVAHGLSGEEIVARLQRHTSVPVPANVLHEVREWAGWVRSVEAMPLTVVRCPDAATADRVVSVLGRQAERLGERLVAVPQGSLGLGERNRLQEHGILLRLTSPAESPRPAPKKRRR
jgi:hypothetical protein